MSQYHARIHRPFLIIPSDLQKRCGNHQWSGNYGNMTNFSIKIASADRLAPSGFRASAGTMMAYTHTYKRTYVWYRYLTYQPHRWDLGQYPLSPNQAVLSHCDGVWHVNWLDELSPVIVRNQRAYVHQVIGNKLGMSTIFSSQWRSLLYIKSMRPSDIHMH